MWRDIVQSTLRRVVLVFVFKGPSHGQSSKKVSEYITHLLYTSISLLKKSIQIYDRYPSTILRIRTLELPFRASSGFFPSPSPNKGSKENPLPVFPPLNLEGLGGESQSSSLNYSSFYYI